MQKIKSPHTLLVFRSSLLFSIFLSLIVLSACTSKEQQLEQDCMEEKRGIPCAEWAEILEEKGEAEKAWRAVRRACELNHGDSCFKYAEKVLDEKPDAAKNFFKIGCNKGHKPSCGKWQELLDKQLTN